MVNKYRCSVKDRGEFSSEHYRILWLWDAWGLMMSTSQSAATFGLVMFSHSGAWRCEMWRVDWQSTSRRMPGQKRKLTKPPVKSRFPRPPKGESCFPVPPLPRIRKLPINQGKFHQSQMAESLHGQRPPNSWSLPVPIKSDVLQPSMLEAKSLSSSLQQLLP